MKNYCVICEADKLEAGNPICICEGCLDMGYRLTEPMDLMEVA